MNKFVEKIPFAKPIIKMNVKFILFIMRKLYWVLAKNATILEDGVHPKHRLMNYHQFFLNNVEQNDIVLDLGCSEGLVSLDMAEKVKEVVGIDHNEKRIRRAQENLRKSNCNNVSFIVGDITNMQFNRKFDNIILSNVLEHIEKRNKFLRKLQELSSTILLRVPMLNRDWITLYKRELGMEFRLDKTHYVEYTEESLKSELKAAGWNLVQHTIKFGELWGIVKRNT